MPKEGEEDPFIVKKPQTNRTFDMLREFCCQRRTLAFLLLILGVILVITGMCFSPSFDRYSDGLILHGEDDSAKEEKPPPKRKVEIKTENQPKTSIRKQIFTAVITNEVTVNNIPLVVRAWASDIQKSKFSGGMHFVTETPISLYTFPVKVVGTAYLRDYKVKMMWKLLESMRDYNQNSRALWYLAVSDSVFLNSSCIESFTDSLSAKYDPMKRNFVAIATHENQFATVMSRAAVKNLVNQDYKPDTVDDFITSLVNMSTPMTNEMVILGNFDKKTEEELSSSKFQFAKCSETKGRSISNQKIFLWLLGGKNSESIPNMKKLPVCSVMKEDSNLRLCYN